MKASITRKLLDNVKPTPKPFDIRCTRIKGLIVRVQPTGNMTFYCEYGRHKRFRIGRTDHISINEAHERVREVLRDVYYDIDPAAQKRKKHDELTLQEFMAEYYDPWAVTHLKSGEAIAKRIKNAFKGLLARKLTQISIFDMEKWRAGRLLDGIAPTTVNRDVGALKASLSRAEEWELIEHNPLLKLKKLKVEDVTPPRYLKDGERERLFSAIDGREQRRIDERDRYNLWRLERKRNEYPDYKKLPFTDHLKPMIILSLNTGLRKNELFTLTWDNVHLDHPTPFLTVIAAFSKSKRSRHVQLNKLAVNTLRSWKTMWENNVNNLVFASRLGEVMDNINSSWRRLLKEAELTNFRWHDMRHDFASRLAMAGVNLNTVRELLGHSDYKMTLRYAHLSPNEGSKAVDLLI